jgi:type I restriction enzyme S subunit
MSNQNCPPNGWEKARVGDLVTLVNGYAFKPGDWHGEGLPIIRIQNLNNADTAFNRTLADVPDKYRVKTGDLLFAWSGTPGTSFGAHIWQGEDALLNQHIFNVRFDPECLEPRFFRYAINYNLTEYIRQAHGGAGLAHITKGKFEDSVLLIAPLNEQRRIVAKIEELFSDLDAGVAALERIRANLKRYRAAVLKAAVEGRLTEEWRAKHPKTEPVTKLLECILAERRQKWEEDQLAKFAAADKSPPKGWREKYVEPVAPDTSGLPELPQGWCWTTAEQLSDAVRSITYGVVKLGDPMEHGVPTLRSSNVRSLRLELDDVKQISPSIARKYKRTFLEGGELLFTVRGTLGGIAVAPDFCRGWNVSREIAVLVPVERAISYLLSLFVASPPLQNWLSRNTRGIAYTGVNIETLKELPIPLAPLEEIPQIVDTVEERLSQIASAEAITGLGLIRAARLRQSILKRAFEGRLVPQDPTDEPADKLLDRIRQERAARNDSVAPRTRRRRASSEQAEGETHGAAS